MASTSSKKTKKSQQHTIKPPLVSIIIGIVGVLIIFSLIRILQYGSIQGAILESKSFPGAMAPPLVKGRSSIDNLISKTTATLNNLPSVNLGYTSPLQKADRCVKGERNFPIAGATNDNYAYWCEVSARQYFGYTNDICPVLASLKQAGMNIYTQTTQDCRSQVPGLQAGVNNNYYYSSPDHKLGSVEVASLLDFKTSAYADFSYGAEYTLTFDHCNQSSGRHQVYCKQQNNSKDEVTTTINSIPVNVSTIVTYKLDQHTYYQK